MSTEYVVTALFSLVIAAALISWVAFQAGRLKGYRSGLEKGTNLSSQVQHIKGINDGYVMALQHTPGQRAEYMNNVLLKTGAITKGDIEAERRLRFQLQLES